MVGGVEEVVVVGRAVWRGRKGGRGGSGRQGGVVCWDGGGTSGSGGRHRHFSIYVATL